MKTASRLKLAATVASVVRASTRPGAPSLPERVQAVPRLVRSTVQGTYAGTTLKRLGLVAGAVAYVASPVDLLPEAVLPVLGAADDAVVISWLVKAFVEETDRFLAWEAGQGFSGACGRRGRGAETSSTSGASRTTVPGSVEAVGDAPVAFGAPIVAAAGDTPRADRDVTGAAAGPGDAGHGDHVRLPEGMRQAATDFVLESVRKRLER
ncbi:YkvA family protein [Terrabacter sp. NPDC080008]|uniref:YkvA family protein n=1 Tax=Terrabacter sp. NPDC080008 TaxID=3155176 RepID=UPI00345094EF